MCLTGFELRTMNTSLFYLCTFVANDDHNGQSIVDKSNWIGKVLVCPCALQLQAEV